MGLGQWRVKLGRRLALFGMLAIAAGALVVLGTVTAGASVVDTIVLSNGEPGEGVEGHAIIDQVVAKFVDTGNASVGASCAADRYSASIDWGDGTSSSEGTVSCLGDNPGGGFEVTGTHTYVDSGNYSIAVTVTDTGDTPNVSKSGTTDSAQISDAGISATTATNVLGNEGPTVEGDSVRANASFFDSNTIFAEDDTVDPGLTATINWGDGTTSAGTISWPDCGECGNVRVSGSHVYDANMPATKPYSASITLKDDGGATATSQAGDTPAIADAALTAGSSKSVSATAGTAFSPTVASFTDAAGTQGSAADFTASIKWGDGTTSTGSVTAGSTAGTFNVRGTHTYATSGTKSLTITVTDEEGQTVTITATATVAAAPIVLPSTGSPVPSQPMPLLYLWLALMGVTLTTVGLVRRRQTRA